MRKYRAIRKLGVSTHTMARMAATPAITYGVDVMGMSDSMLQNARCIVATAAAPGAGGKTPDLVLCALDCAGGTLDPAYDAIGLPIKHWAMAWWEGWIPPADLDRSARYASARLRTAVKSVWQRVTGPVAALLASLWRIGWSVECPHRLRTDRGRLLDLKLDPPVVVHAEAKHAIKRWQLARVIKLNPCWGPPSAGSAGDPSASSCSVVKGPFAPPQRSSRIRS